MKRESAESYVFFMVEKLYWLDSYVREFGATITKVDGNNVYLDKSAFYPTGGEQPNDRGTLVCNDRIYEVVDVSKEGEEIIHALNDADGLEEGDECSCSIDWQRRYGHMRHHTALHIIDGVVFKGYEGRITGGQIYQDRGRMDFDMKGMDRDVMQRVIDGAQKVVEEKRRVYPRIIGKEEAMAIPDLSRTDPGTDLLSKLDEIRVIEIEGFDVQLDGGTHVANTKEVGTIMLDKYENKGSSHKRVTIRLQ